jgi:hypothetical protein
VSQQPFLIGEGWMEVLDGDATAEALFRRHYSRRNHVRKKRGLIIGPGQKMLLVLHDATAVFAWRLEKHRLDDQVGVNCAIFRNESSRLSSELIREADALADRRWPGARHFTFVDGAQTASRRSNRAQAGVCFIHAGWRACGTSSKGLAILERPAT